MAPTARNKAVSVLATPDGSPVLSRASSARPGAIRVLVFCLEELEGSTMGSPRHVQPDTTVAAELSIWQPRVMPSSVYQTTACRRSGRDSSTPVPSCPQTLAARACPDSKDSLTCLLSLARQWKPCLAFCIRTCTKTSGDGGARAGAIWQRQTRRPLRMPCHHPQAQAPQTRPTLKTGARPSLPARPLPTLLDTRSHGETALLRS